MSAPFLFSIRFLHPALLLMLFGLQWFSLATASAADATTATENDSIEILVQRNVVDGNEVFNVQSSMIVAATAETSWQVMTDYDHLATFVPGFTSSHLVSRNGNEAVLAQEGYVQFFFIKQALNLLLSVHEQAYVSVDLNLITGNMRQYEAHWQLIPADQTHTKILYNATLAPTFFVPPLIGVSLMKGDLRKMLSAVAIRITQGNPQQGQIEIKPGTAPNTR